MNKEPIWLKHQLNTSQAYKQPTQVIVKEPENEYALFDHVEVLVWRSKHIVITPKS